MLELIFTLLILGLAAVLIYYVGFPLLPIWLLVRFHLEIGRAHAALAAAIVRTVRDDLVRNAMSKTPRDAVVRLMLLVWIVMVPIISAGILILIETVAWTAILTIFNSGWFLRGFFWWLFAISDNIQHLALALSIPSVIVVIYHYYHYFFNGPLTDGRIVRFAQEPWILWGKARAIWIKWVVKGKI